MPLLFARYFHTCNLPMAKVSFGGILVEANWALCSLLGYTEAELKTKHFVELTHPEDGGADQQLFEQLIDPHSQCHSYHLKKRWFTKQGRCVYGVLHVWNIDKRNGATTDTSTGLVLSTIHNVTELQVNNHAFFALRDAVLDGVWDWNVVEHKEYYSRRFWEVLGIDPESKRDECRPEAWQELIHPEDLPRALDLAEAHVRSRGRVPFSLEARYMHPNGKKTVYVICQGLVVEWDKHDRPLRWIGTHTDVTQLKLKEQEVARDLQKHTQFYRRQSHEIRNAMYSIISVLSELKQYGTKVLDEDMRGMVNLASDSADTLLAVLNDTLDLGKLQAGKMELSPQSVSPVTLVRRLVRLNSARAQKLSGTRLVVEADGRTVESSPGVTEARLASSGTGGASGAGSSASSGSGGGASDQRLPAHILIDPVRLRQVLDNFLSNAIKFTRSGTITVGVRPHPTVRNMLTFYVRDTGVGMTPEEQSRLFHEYTQFRHSRTASCTSPRSEEDEVSPRPTAGLGAEHERGRESTCGTKEVEEEEEEEAEDEDSDGLEAKGQTDQLVRSYRGTGLGLSICQYLSLLLGGTIEVTSEKGRGSEFAISVPILLPPNTPEDGVRKPKAPATDTTMIEKMRVMVVDDSKVNLMVARRHLKFLERAPTLCQSGAKCLEAFTEAEGGFDLVFMDCNMPDMDGYETTRRLLSLPCYSHTRVVALTGDFAGKELAAQCGMHHFLTKPVTRKEFIDVMHKCRS